MARSGGRGIWGGDVRVADRSIDETSSYKKLLGR